MTNPENPNNSAQVEKENAPKPQIRSALRNTSLKLLLALGLTLVVLLSLFSWVLWTQAGTQAALRVAQSLSGDLVKFSRVTGRFTEEIRIDELAFQNKNSKVLASGIRMIWRPRALLDGKLVIDTLEVSALRIASVANATPAQLPLNLLLPLPITVENAALGRLDIAILQKDGSETPTVQLSALTAQLDSSLAQHVVKTEFTSPWGKLHAQGQIASSKPFALTGTFAYSGQVIKAIPKLGINGMLSGTLEKIIIVAKANREVAVDALQPKISKRSSVLQGGFSAQIKPFSLQPIFALQADISGLNPADFSPNAPQAELQIRANLNTDDHPSSSMKLGGEAKSLPTQSSKIRLAAPALVGSIEIENTQPGRLDQHAIPLTILKSELKWSDSALLLKNALVRLSGNGRMLGQINIVIPNHGLPLVEANMKLDAINLAQIDGRVKATQISGVIHADTVTANNGKIGVATILNFQAHLQDPRASLKLDANYQIDDATVAKQNSILRLTRFELNAADSHVQGKGEVDFSAERKFNFQAGLTRFDPSHWIKMPAGHIDADIAVNGHLTPKLFINIQLPRIAGEYAGQPLSGEFDASWQEASALSVKKADLRWGKNNLTAHGSLSMDNERDGDELSINLDAQDVSALSHLVGMDLIGNIQADTRLRGTFSNPSGKVNVVAKGIGIEKIVYLDKLRASINIGSEKNAVFNAEIVAQELRLDPSATRKKQTLVVAAKPNSTGQSRTGNLPLFAEQVELRVNGTRELHRLDLTANLNAARQLSLSASGGLQTNAAKILQWSGQLASLALSGDPAIKLQAPVQIKADQSSLQIGSAQLTSGLGKLALEEFEWTPASIKTRGKLSDVKIMDVVNLFNSQHAIDGDLLLSADWNLQLKDNVLGEVNLQRQSGDVRVNDIDGTGQALPMGLSELQMKLGLGGLVAGSDAERISLQVNTSGTRLGSWKLNANSQIKKIGEQWKLFDEAKLNGDLHADIQDLQWLGPWLNPGLALKGKLKLDATLDGVIGTPRYKAQVEGRELELAFASEGVLLPNGSLSAELDEKHIKLNQLKFSNKVSLMPKHAKFRDINWVGQTGEVSASGEIDLIGQSGSFLAQFEKFPLLQRNDRWVIVSGQTNIKQQSNIWSLTGQLNADGGFFKLPKTPPPSLSGDVVVNRGKKKNAVQDSELNQGRKGIKTRLDITLDLGPQFVFVGSGLDTGLTGTVRLRSNDGAALQASGTIRAEDGVYEGYGQKLAIERGILSFQGAPSNPGLNILALRKGLEVEAGVEVSGTVAAPKVHLVSEPSVPDAEKLSWLVLGVGAADIASSQGSVLLSAAGAIFGDDSGRNIPRDIVQGLGLDEFSVGAAETGASSKLPGQTVAGATAVGTVSGDQVLSIGKRLRPGLVLSVERGLSDASGALKLSWQLTRRISIIARKGNESSLDAYYTFSFH